MTPPTQRPLPRPSVEIDCRLQVVADLIQLARLGRLNARAAIDGIAQLIPSLQEHASFLTDDVDDAPGIPKTIANEIRLLTA